MALMSNTVVNLKSTNNDLIKVSVGQYNLDNSREAWVNVAQLPQGIKKDLRSGEHVKNTVKLVHILNHCLC